MLPRQGKQYSGMQQTFSEQPNAIRDCRYFKRNSHSICLCMYGLFTALFTNVAYVLPCLTSDVSFVFRCKPGFMAKSYVYSVTCLQYLPPDVSHIAFNAK